MNYTYVTAKEARNNFAEILERAGTASEVFIVTKFGKEKVLISPVRRDNYKRDAQFRKVLNETFGIWKNRKEMKDPAKWVASLRKKEMSRHGKIFD